MITPETHVGDDLRITVAVKKSDGTAKDITGATVNALAAISTVSVAPVSVTISDGPGGKIAVDFGRLLTVAGQWNIQVRVELADRKTVVDDQHTVKQSIF